MQITPIMHPFLYIDLTQRSSERTWTEKMILLDSQGSKTKRSYIVEGIISGSALIGSNFLFKRGHCCMFRSNVCVCFSFWWAEANSDLECGSFAGKPWRMSWLELQTEWRSLEGRRGRCHPAQWILARTAHTPSSPILRPCYTGQLSAIFPLFLWKNDFLNITIKTKEHSVHHTSLYRVFKVHSSQHIFLNKALNCLDGTK